MYIQELLDYLYYYCQCGTKGEFARQLFLNAYESPKNMKKKSNPVQSLTDDTLRSYFSGRSVAALASKILPGLSKDNLKKYLDENITDDNLDWMAEEMEQFDFVSDLPLTAENVTEILADQFVDLIRSEAKEHQTKNRKPRSFRNNTIKPEEIELINETDGRCPLCNKNIMISGPSKKGASKFRVVQLYTNSLADECGLFDSVEIPYDLNSDGNKIVLCEKCANKYEQAPTIHTYQILKEIKKNCVMSRSLNSLSLDEEIMEVVEALYSVDGDDEKIKELALTYEPVEVDKKITDNYILKREIRSKVIDFFNYIDIKLSELDENVMRSDEIASDIHRAYKRLKENNFEKNEIVNKLSEWILEKTKLNHKNAKYKSAAEIIVAYYIQSCQVFEDETSK